VKGESRKQSVSNYTKCWKGKQAKQPGQQQKQPPWGIGKNKNRKRSKVMWEKFYVLWCLAESFVERSG